RSALHARGSSAPLGPLVDLFACPSSFSDKPASHATCSIFFRDRTLGARDVEALGLRWLGPQCVRAAHGGSTRGACSPSVIDLGRRPHHQGGDLSGISLAIQSLAIHEARGFALRLTVTVQ